MPGSRVNSKLLCLFDFMSALFGKAKWECKKGTLLWAVITMSLAPLPALGRCSAQSGRTGRRAPRPRLPSSSPRPPRSRSCRLGAGLWWYPTWWKDGGPPKTGGFFAEATTGFSGPFPSVIFIYSYCYYFSRILWRRITNYFIATFLLSSRRIWRYWIK